MKKIIVPKDDRSGKFIFVPFCLICQAFQARGIVRLGFSSVITPIIEEILKMDLNIIQMPCPESLFGGYPNGLSRKPKSIHDYDIPDFLAVCREQAENVLRMIKGILDNDYEVVAILGMEFSPSCSTDLQYTNQGTIHRAGFFVQALQDLLKKEQIEIPFVGINRRGIKSTIRKIRTIVVEKEQEELF